MSITFRENPELPKGNVNIIVEASEATKETIKLMQEIKALQQRNMNTIAIEANGGFEIIPTSSIVAVENDGEMLNIHALAGKENAGRKSPPITTFTTRDTLVHFLTRLPSDFVRISRQALISVRHLRSLKLSYSGNMSASLDGGMEETVGRRYVPNLRKIIGA
ncbi:LytTR family DNA-binding domain-containing protein [Bifidobacterium sp. ESL0784]|uniref:LytTR family DNA-binding domain-containing protein n=1 Tax=Bifidobacterium sp. ESL0784 TaxID=2983231 RepID=UPI0023F70C31|nr:LytTR family DNA-binding domain-containing protein [Bifidobacterium sp. ESL0784]MDF7640600.1 LytTR family DNA-binding domain-containing protein [Bifidobacterium sp. ESL0784]